MKVFCHESLELYGTVSIQFLVGDFSKDIYRKVVLRFYSMYANADVIM